MSKKYKIVNSFIDVYTNEKYTSDHDPVEFSEKRVEEIQLVEKVLGYPLIEEINIEKAPIESTNDLIENSGEIPITESVKIIKNPKKEK